jgi:nitrite reductase/ring-hydroxylating ferredoxin subunit
MAAAVTLGHVGLHRLRFGRWRVRIGGWDVLVSVSPLRVWAFAAVCPHRGLPLDNGVIRGATITCPFHGRTFDLRDGHPVRAAGCGPLTVFDVVRKGGRLLLRLPGPGD